MANLTSIKKGDKVLLRMFTGAFVEAKEVEKADKNTISFTNKKGVVMTFSKKTGKQIEPEPKSEKFANYIEEYDADVETEELKKKKNKATPKKKKASKKSVKEVEVVKSKVIDEPEDDEDDDYEELDDEE